MDLAAWSRRDRCGKRGEPWNECAFADARRPSADLSAARICSARRACNDESHKTDRGFSRWPSRSPRSFAQSPLFIAAPAAAQDEPRARPGSSAATRSPSRSSSMQAAVPARGRLADAGSSSTTGWRWTSGPNLTERFIAAEEAKLAELRAALARESDPQLKQDLQILIDSLERDIEGTRLERPADARLVRRAADRVRQPERAARRPGRARAARQGEASCSSATPGSTRAPRR